MSKISKLSKSVQKSKMSKLSNVKNYKEYQALSNILQFYKLSKIINSFKNIEIVKNVIKKWGGGALVIYDNLRNFFENMAICKNCQI